MSREQEIRTRLEAAMAGAAIDVTDESHKHAGHHGHSGSGESHFRLKIQWDGFADLSRVARHRAVHDALGKDLTRAIHALALELSA